jgi:hypothetical protein
MKEKLISYETAKLAREKGFDWETQDWFLNDKPNSAGVPRLARNHNAEYYPIRKSRPTLSLLQKWLIDVKGYFPYPVAFGKDHWSFDIDRLGASALKVISCHSQALYPTYEDAFEASLIKCLMFDNI